MPAATQPETARSPSPPAIPRFDFERDTFAFANELHWEYRFDPATGRTTFSRRAPKPAYAHRCFVLVRAARQFLFHAQFDVAQPAIAADEYRHLVRKVMARTPRAPCAAGRKIIFPGYSSLREFSKAQEPVLKSTCGGAWQSYVLRSHWRMVFPISRQHQSQTAERLVQQIRSGAAPIAHLVLFPKLTINHGVLLFEVTEDAAGFQFRAYDPNAPEQPTSLSFNQEHSTFSFPANRYWAGGALNVIEIYRSVWS